MSYNPAAVRAALARKSSAAREYYRANSFKNAPFVQLAELDNGSYRGRFWPSDPKKNPNGFLDYRLHAIPQGYLIDGVDPRNALVQCPRSNNYDPFPIETDTYGYPVYKERCACCEIDDYVSTPLYDDAGEEIPGTELFHQLPEHLKQVLSAMNWRSAGGSAVFFPCSIMMSVQSRTKRTLDSGKEVEDVVYQPDASNRLDVLLKFRPEAQLLEKIYTLLEQDPFCSDLSQGRWWTLTKKNDGKGSGGYDIMMDLNQSQAGFEADYGLHSDLTKWGSGGKKSPNRRMGHAGQLSIIENADWANEMFANGVPLNDTQALQLEQMAQQQGSEPHPF